MTAEREPRREPIPDADVERVRRDFGGAGMVDLVGQGRFGATPVKLVERRPHGEWHGLCPFHADRKPSFAVVIDRPQRPAFYHCFACGAHGSAIDYVMHTAQVDFREAVLRMLGRVDSPRSAPARVETPRERAEREGEAEASAARKAEAARLLWRGAVAGAGTVVETYLREGRCIPMTPPATLRCGSPQLGRAALDVLGWRTHPGFGRYPMMVAPFVSVDDRLTGVHITFLPFDGVGAMGDGRVGLQRRKLMLGGAWGSAIRLAPAGPRLCSGEGIETTLSGMWLNPGWPGWAAGSLGNLAGAGADRALPHPELPGKWVPSVVPAMDRPGMVLPAIVQEVAGLGDSDGDRLVTHALMRRAATRWRREGRRARLVWAPEGRDWNDVLRAPARSAPAPAPGAGLAA